MGPAMVTGTLLATSLSAWVPQRALALAFAAIVYAGATQILLGRTPAAARTLPGTPALVAIGLLVGVVSGLVSAGGAFMTVPLMLFFGVAMTTAIGTGAALGVPVAMVGTLGYMLSGWRVADLPPLALGFVYVPALLAIVAGSVLTAPLGARAAHRMPVRTLRRIFAGLPTSWRRRRCGPTPDAARRGPITARQCAALRRRTSVHADRIEAPPGCAVVERRDGAGERRRRSAGGPIRRQRCHRGRRRPARGRGRGVDAAVPHPCRRRGLARRAAAQRRGGDARLPRAPARRRGRAIERVLRGWLLAAAVELPATPSPSPACCWPGSARLACASWAQRIGRIRLSPRWHLRRRVHGGRMAALLPAHRLPGTSSASTSTGCRTRPSAVAGRASSARAWRRRWSRLALLGLAVLRRAAPRRRSAGGSGARWWCSRSSPSGIVVAPVFIAPLFNTYKPLDRRRCATPILPLARANGVPVDNVWEFDASKQTKRVSANVSGLLGTERGEPQRQPAAATHPARASSR